MLKGFLRVKMSEMKRALVKEKHSNAFQKSVIFDNIDVLNKTNWRKFHVKTTNWCRGYGCYGT